MHKNSYLAVLFFILFFVASFLKAEITFAYACSSHVGIDCEAGADTDGSVICTDGWADSEILYADIKEECGEKYTEHKKYFYDLQGNQKNYKAVMYLADIGIIGGYADGSFKPENEINRAEFIKILVEGAGISPKVEEYNNCFTDIKNEWFAPYVCYAKSINWIAGYPEGNYKPSQTVNKAEAIKMVLNSQNIEIPETIDLSPFEDVPVDSWFAPYVKTAKDLGILEEAGNLFNSEDNMKRASVSENLYRTIKFKTQLKNPDTEFVEKEIVDNENTESKLYLIAKIIDGDTIELLSGEKVRLLGINAPEKNEDYYNDAKIYLSELIGTSEVRLESDELNKNTDDYGRLLRYVYVDNILLNLELVKSGLALYYQSFPIKKADEFARAEKQAEDAKLGIWTELEEEVVEGIHEADLYISFVFYDGVVPKVESDEYVEITNRSEVDVNLEGYYIIGSKGEEKFIFDEYILKSGQSVKVTTNEEAPTFGNDSAIWSNSGETVYLYDESGNLVDSYGW